MVKESKNGKMAQYISECTLMIFSKAMENLFTAIKMNTKENSKMAWPMAKESIHKLKSKFNMMALGITISFTGKVSI